MSETKFTKGEWQVLPLEDDKEYIRIRGTMLGGKYKIANVDDMKHHHDDGKKWCEVEREQAMANANLIASAPDMYAMLEGMINEAEGYEKRTGKSVTWKKEATTLLAKARGES